MTHTAQQISEMTDEQLYAAIRELATRQASRTAVGDEHAAGRRNSQYANLMQPYIDEIVRRDEAAR